MTALLTVDGLRKVFASRAPRGGAGHVAVGDVAFHIDPGECLAVVGESGSGKTTTARIIAGLETADAGRIVLAGADLDLRRRRRGGGRVQMVFQDPFGSLDPRQRIGRAVDEMLRLHQPLDRAGRRARMLELLDQVGLDERHAAELPRSLSGGQRQRVAIARALAAGPDLLILDEAVSALDVSVQAQVLNLLSDIRSATGIAYLFVTHDLAVVRQISDRCVVLREGRVVEAGATTELLARPREEYTRRLIDAVPRPGWTPRRRSTGGAPRD